MIDGRRLGGGVFDGCQKSGLEGLFLSGDSGQGLVGGGRLGGGVLDGRRPVGLQVLVFSGDSGQGLVGGGRLADGVFGGRRKCGLEGPIISGNTSQGLVDGGRLSGGVLDGRGQGGLEGLFLSGDSVQGLVGSGDVGVRIVDARITLCHDGSKGIPLGDEGGQHLSYLEDVICTKHLITQPGWIDPHSRQVLSELPHHGLRERPNVADGELINPTLIAQPRKQVCCTAPILVT
jgi:hypothetical protein